MSIGRILVMLALWSSLFGVVVALGVTLAHDQYHWQQQSRQQLTRIADQVAPDLEAALEAGDHGGLQQILSQLVSHSDLDGACLRQRAADQALPLAEAGQSCSLESGKARSLTVTRLVNSPGEPAAAELVLQRSRTSLHQHLLAHLGLYAGTSLLAVLLTLAVARPQIRRLLRPLRELNAMVRQAARHHDYQLRVAESGDDEVGTLAQAFNHMLTTLAEDHQRLTESEQRFRMISQHSQVGILQLDATGRTIYVNDEMLRITTLQRDQISVDSLVALVHPDDRRLVRERIRRLRLYGEEISLDCCLYLPDRELRWISVHMAPLPTPDGAPTSFLGTLSDITALRSAHDQLQQMAFYDLLTGLANRRLFRDRLEQLLGNVQRSASRFTLILLDLDHFKLINDTLGHAAGDMLLTVVAQRLKQCVRFTDTVARLGGDEFAVLLPNIGETLAASSIARKILASLSRPVLLEGHEIDVRTSLGLAMAPTDSSDADTLIRYADLALYQAKSEGRNRYHFYTAEMNTLLVEHFRLARDLRQALAQGGLSLSYQPQVQLATGELLGFEALLRWEHPERGTVLPATMVDVAEDNGMMVPLGRWVLETACRQLAALNQARLVSRRAIMAINLSSQQLQDPGFLPHLRQTLQQWGLRPQQLELELSEAAIMSEPDRTQSLLQALQDEGVTLAIDNFGAGGASPSRLKRLPVNLLKIDRHLIRDLPYSQGGREVVSALIAMAHQLRYKVVAEGLETTGQYQFLRAAGCDFGQGHLISPPIPPEELAAFCEEYQERLETELTTRKHGV